MVTYYIFVAFFSPFHCFQNPNFLENDKQNLYSLQLQNVYNAVK